MEKTCSKPPPRRTTGNLVDSHCSPGTGRVPGTPNHAETLRLGWNSADALNLTAMARCQAIWPEDSNSY